MVARIIGTAVVYILVIWQLWAMNDEPPVGVAVLGAIVAVVFIASAGSKWETVERDVLD